MKAFFSAYLKSIEPGLKQLVEILSEAYDYVSILSTDSKGLRVMISRHARSVGSETMTTERGTVVRVARNGLYSEYAFNDFDPKHPEEAAAMLKKELDAQLDLLASLNTPVYKTGVLDDEPCELFVEKETGELPEETDVKALVERLSAISDKAMGLSEYMIDCMAVAQSTHINKLFLTKNRHMAQSYVYSEGFIQVLVHKDGQTRAGREGISGLAGPEIFEQLSDKTEAAVQQALLLLDAGRIEPGEYDIICTPEVSGLIAHEAFGHGVEMDMFVKGRALGQQYIGQRVGSDLVTMHEGALCADNVTSYAFDDEGVLAGDVIEIDHGILKTGICDALSAKRLGTVPTGNGKRQNYAHKVYTRMTNTMFDSGTCTAEEMIASVKDGWLLEGMQSGMEDPKHWGIQCIIDHAYEIKDGKKTGRVVAPVIMTGYVPDLLGNVTMVSKDREVFGTGGCGKGHKEWVKVADGGPYLKTKGWLG